MATKTKARKATKKRAAQATTADKAYRVAKIQKSAKTINLADLATEYVRADLEFIGVDHAGASFEARVYVNNPSADAETQPTEGNGYAGSFYVFGHGGCFGDAGHCDLPQRTDQFDPRPSHPLEPIKKVVIATDAIKKAAAAKTSSLNVTVVPVVTSWTDQVETEDVLKFDHINLVTYY